ADQRIVVRTRGNGAASSAGAGSYGPQHNATPRRRAGSIVGATPTARTYAGLVTSAATCAAICAPAESPPRNTRLGSIEKRAALSARNRSATIVCRTGVA